MSAVERLQQNNPAVTTIWIQLWREPSDAEIALALEQNPFITEIQLVVGGVLETNWRALLRVIAARENLLVVELSDAHPAGARNAPPILIHAFLRAFQQNNSIRLVSLISVCLPVDVSTFFVDTASSVTTLAFANCDFAPTERERGTRDLAAALQRNTNIKTLQLSFRGDISAILHGLRSNVCLKSIKFSGMSFDNGGSSGIQQLLDATTSIQQFEVMEVTFRGETLRPVAQSLIRSASVSTLKFRLCAFGDEESTAIFRSILQEKRNLTSLRLDNCAFDGRELHDIIISTLSRLDSALRTLEIESFLGFFTHDQLQNLFRAIEKSKLVCFKIGQFRSHEQLQILTQSIPSMSIKELTIVFYSNIDEGAAKREVLQAVKNNFRLRSVDGKVSFNFGPERDFFDNNDKLSFVFYADRNERLDQWVDNPETVEQKVWPDALQLAQKAGPDSLFRGMRSVLESDYGSLPGARKRKRL